MVEHNDCPGHKAGDQLRSELRCPKPFDHGGIRQRRQVRPAVFFIELLAFIRGEDQNRFVKGDRIVVEFICKDCPFQDAQEKQPDRRARFLYLVEKQNAFGIRPDKTRKLSWLRRPIRFFETHQPAHGIVVPASVGCHIKAPVSISRIRHILREFFRQIGLAGSGRARKEIDACRFARPPPPELVADKAIHKLVDRHILSHNALFQPRFQRFVRVCKFMDVCFIKLMPAFFKLLRLIIHEQFRKYRCAISAKTLVSRLFNQLAQYRIFADILRFLHIHQSFCARVVNLSVEPGEISFENITQEPEAEWGKGNAALTIFQAFITKLFQFSGKSLLQGLICFPQLCIAPQNAFQFFLASCKKLTGRE